MLGQEDNPGKLREEMERAKQKAEGGRRKAEGNERAGHVSASSIPPHPPIRLHLPIPPLRSPQFSWPRACRKRMAIISAGVIMNAIFAFFMAVVAFSMGVEQAAVHHRLGLSRRPRLAGRYRVGDEILEIAGKKMEQFRDLQTAISLGDIDPEKGVPLLVRRPGVKDR